VGCYKIGCEVWRMGNEDVLCNLVEGTVSARGIIAKQPVASRYFATFLFCLCF